MTKFIISALVLISSQALLNLTGIEGKWTGFVESEIGSFPISVEYNVEGEVLSGIFENANGPSSFEGGHITGNTFEYQCEGEGYTFTHKGTIQGDTIHLTWSSSALGEGKGLLTRQK